MGWRGIFVLDSNFSVTDSNMQERSFIQWITFTFYVKDMYFFAFAP